MAVTKAPRGVGLEALELLEAEPEAYAAPADLSSDEEHLSPEEADPSRAARLKRSVARGTESLKAAFSKESVGRTRDTLGTRFHSLGQRVLPPERRGRMQQAGERLKENLAKRAPGRDAFRLRLKKERAVAEGQEGAAAAEEGEEGREEGPGQLETKREGPAEEAGAARIGE